jgi:hypothetical protein
MATKIVNAVPIFNIDTNVNLVGVNGVQIDGEYYDVTFGNNSCVGLYGSCSVDDFTFTTQFEAIAAANSIIAQVFEVVR